MIKLYSFKSIKCLTNFNFLGKIFDCDIQPVIFSFYALVTFFVKLLESPRTTSDISQELLSLEYKIPDCKSNSRLKVTLFLKDTTIVLAMLVLNCFYIIKIVSSMLIVNNLCFSYLISFVS